MTEETVMEGFREEEEVEVGAMAKTHGSLQSKI